MPSLSYNTFAMELLDGTRNLTTETLRVMLVDSSYIENQDDDVIDAGGANDPIDAEISVTGYVGGFGGSGRRALVNKSFSVDDANNRGVFDNTADIVWTSLGSGVTIQAAIVIIEITNDTLSRLCAYLELATPIATNGSDFTLQFNALGVIILNT